MAATISINGKSLQDVRLAIFDKDGTLIDVHTYWANMVDFRAVRICDRLGLGKDMRFGIMDSMGVEMPGMKIKPAGPVGLKKREIVLRAGVDYLMAQGLEDQTSLFEEIFREVDIFSLSQLDTIIRPLTGLHTLFAGLKRNNCRIALATTDRSDRAALAMQHLGLAAETDFIAGADMVTNPKPAPEIINLICDKLEVSPDHTIMVGDSGADVMTGVNASCLASIGVASGLTPSAELLRLTPHVIPDISHISIS